MDSNGPGVFVISSSRDIEVLIEAVLESQGIKAISFTSGRRALVWLEACGTGQEVPALGIIDWELNDIDPGILLRQLRALPCGNLLHLVVLVEHDPAARLAACQAGADFCMEKPVVPAELLSAARAAFGRVRFLKAASERSRRLETLIQSMRAVNRSLELEDILWTAADITVRLFYVDGCSFVLVEPSGESALLRSFHLKDGHLRAVPAERISWERCRLEKQALEANRPISGKPGERTALALPLADGELRIGALTLTRALGKDFVPEEVNDCVELAGQVALAIRNARYFAEMNRKARELSLLHEVARAISSILDPDQLLQRVLKEVRESLGYARCAIFLLNPEKDELYVRAYSGYKGTTMNHVRVQVAGKGITAYAARRMELVYVPDVTRDQRYVQVERGIRSELAIPLVHAGQVLGVLDFESTELDGFQSRDIELLRHFADQVSIAISNSSLFDRLKEQAISDSLTKLRNRLFFIEAIEIEFSRSQRSGKPFSLVMMDLDGFKRVNDKLGHMAGDIVLCRVAAVLRQNSRRSDVIARYGGDEFAALLPETDSHSAALFAEKLRRKLRKDRDLRAKEITASFGVSSYPEYAGCVEELISQADGAMYQAKREGGDRVLLPLSFLANQRHKRNS